MLFSVKNTTFPGLLDLLAPHSCRGCGRIGSPLCKRCKKYVLSNHKPICPNCKTPQPPTKGIQPCHHCPDLPPIYVAGAREGLLDDIIRAYKYQSIRALAVPLAELLDHALPQDLGDHPIIVPLPTASHHIRARGFDHTAFLAKHLAKLRSIKVRPLLARAKNTVQVGVDQATRQAQAKQAYMVNPKITIDPSATYILLDDIWTTGASVKSALDLLHSIGIKNDHIVVALLAYSVE